MKIKLDIVSGFLGAGKTTLIKKLLAEAFTGQKVVLIENEFGEVGIDGSILKDADIQIKEINSGCICCSLAGDLEKAVEEMAARFKPDRILIEPSGVGKLSDVVKTFEGGALQKLISLNTLITVVDIVRYQAYIANFSEFYENQIKNARTLVLSRTGTVEQKKLESVTASLRKLNPTANIITTPWESLSGDYILAVSERREDITLQKQMEEVGRVVLKKHEHPRGCACGCEKKTHRADEVFEVWGSETPGVFSENELKTLVERLAEEARFGHVLRGKGIVRTEENRWVQFDYVPGEVTLRSSKPDYSGRVCIIGCGMKQQALQSLFRISE